MLDPDKPITLGEERDVDRFSHSLILVGRHAHKERRQVHKRLGHLGQILSRQCGYGIHEGLIITLLDFIANVVSKFLSPLFEAFSVFRFSILAAIRHPAIDIVDELAAQAWMYSTDDHIDGFPLRKRNHHGVGRAHPRLVNLRTAQPASRDCANPVLKQRRKRLDLSHSGDHDPAFVRRVKPFLPEHEAHCLAQIRFQGAG